MRLVFSANDLPLPKTDSNFNKTSSNNSSPILASPPKSPMTPTTPETPKEPPTPTKTANNKDKEMNGVSAEEKKEKEQESKSPEIAKEANGDSKPVEELYDIPVGE